MSEVNITGVNGVPPEDWATEFTLLKILQALNSGAKQTKSNSKSQLDILRSLANDSSTGSSQLNELKKISQDTAKNTKEGVKEAKKQSLASAAANKAGFNTQGGAAKSLSDNFTSDGMLGKAIGGLAVVIDNVWAALMASTDGYNKAYKGGAIFSEMANGQDASFKAFTQAAADMQIPLSEMGDIAAKFPQAMNQMGIGKMSEMMVNLRGKMKIFGVTASESADYIGSLTEQYRAMGALDQLNGQRGIEVSEKAFETTKRFAQVLGMSTQQLQEEMALQAKDRTARIAMFNVADSNKKLFGETMKLVESVPEYGEMMNEALANPEAMVGEKLAKFTAVLGEKGVAEVLDLAKKFNSKEGLSRQEVEASLVRTANEAEKIPKDIANAFNKIGDNSVVSFAGGMALVKTNLLSTAEDIGDAHLELHQNVDTIKKGFGSMWENAMSDFLSKDTMAILNDGLKVLGEVLGDVTSKFKEFMTGLGDKDSLKGMFTDAFEWMSTIPEKISSLLELAKYMFQKIIHTIDDPSGEYTKNEFDAEQLVAKAKAAGIDTTKLEAANAEMKSDGSWASIDEADEAARNEAMIEIHDKLYEQEVRARKLKIEKAKDKKAEDEAAKKEIETAKQKAPLVTKNAALPPNTGTAEIQAPAVAAAPTTDYVQMQSQNQTLEEMVYLLRSMNDYLSNLA